MFQQHFLAARIVEFGRTPVGVTGNPLRHLKIAAILQKILLCDGYFFGSCFSLRRLERSSYCAMIT
jgi:hypothetical protein